MSFARPPVAGPSNLRRSNRTGAPSATSGAAPLGRATTSNIPAAATGAKRRTRSTSVDPEKELNTAKRPALAAYSSLVSSTSLQRQLLDAQGKVTSLQNQLLEKQGDVDRLEADRRLLADAEEKERGRREELEKELASEKETSTKAISSLKIRLTTLEQDHEELLERYNDLSYESARTNNALRAEISMKDRESSLLKEQLSSVEAQWELAEKRVAELEKRDPEIAMGNLAISSRESPIVIGDEDEEGEGLDEDAEDESADVGEAIRREFNGGAVHEEDADGEEYEEEDEEDEFADEDMSFTAPIPSSTPAGPRRSRSRRSTPSDVAMSSPLHVPKGNLSDSTSPTAREGQTRGYEEDGEVNLVQEDGFDNGVYVNDDHGNTFHEGQAFSGPLLEAYPDPGAPPPYAVSESSPSPSARSDNSIASSRPDEHIQGTPGMPLRKARAKRGGLAQRAASRSPSVASTSMSTTTTPKRRPSSGASATIVATLRATVERLQSELGKAKEREEHYSLIRDQLSSLTSHMTSLEATNARLTAELQRTKQRAEGTELLREEKRELERKFSGMEELRRRYAELEAKMEDLKRENAKLSRISETNSSPSVSVTGELITLRHQYTTLLEQHGALRAEHASLSSTLSSTQADLDDLKDALEKAEKEREELREEKTRLEAERKLSEREKEFMKSMVESYELEASSLNPDPDASFSTNVASSKLRIEQLETLLGDYKATLAKRDAEVEQMRQIIHSIEQKGSWRGKSKEEWQELEKSKLAVEEALQSAEQTISKQEIRIDQLEQRLFELGGEVGAGRHVPPGIRVLCLRDNPAQRWADTRNEVLERLKNENRALLERLETLENQVSTSGATTQLSKDSDHFVPRESYDALVQTNEELVETVAQKDKRVLRLQQIYAAKSLEFREAIEAILGIKLAFSPNGQVRVTSLYDLSAAFVFKPTASGPNKHSNGDDTKMQLIATGEQAPPEMEEMMRYWIQEEMCIPCFMASVTLECYDKVRRERERVKMQVG